MTGEEQINEYLTFEFGTETFAIEVACVKEVVIYTKITRIPGLPRHLSGIINLRGSIVSIMDARIKLGLDITETSPDTSFIIIEKKDNTQLNETGIPVDSVKEVINFQDFEIEPPPKVGMNMNTACLKGVAMIDKKPVIILDIEKILEDDQPELT